MADDAALGVIQWVLSNPEKGALGLVMIAGVWQWIKEYRRGERGDNERGSVMDALMREIDGLRKDRDTLSDENRELRKELRESRRRNSADPNSGRPPST